MENLSGNANFDETNTSRVNSDGIGSHMEHDDDDRSVNGPPSDEINNHTTRSVHGRDHTSGNIGDYSKADLSRIMVKVSRPDAMSESDSNLYKEVIVEYLKNNCTGGAEPDKVLVVAFFVALCQYALNSGTSVKAISDRTVDLSFGYDNQKYTVKAGHFLSYAQSRTSGHPNALRRFMRSSLETVKQLQDVGLIYSNGVVAAKHGVVKEFRNSYADFDTGHLDRMSNDDLAALMLAKCHALKKSEGNSRTIYNTVQLADMKHPC
ncbi:coat protein [Tomato infectious chlorosis virus]|uniref:Coat protein n=1 Tax=Tomato infectious chlorosis virus TaxID=52135 RepID=C7B985_9CLOS|nr:coat protein [Tomato infectious chlorosis virus]ACS73879.1 coat protein [Tomato infectious chlorosis virus]